MFVVNTHRGEKTDLSLDSVEAHVMVRAARGEQAAARGPGRADHVAGAGPHALDVLHGLREELAVGRARPEGHRAVRRGGRQPAQVALRRRRPVHRRYRACGDTMYVNLY